ncbi:MAG: lysine-2,3-aminomutase-like protein [Proteobacteria bacterium]|nr:lysine-2,3-aminomutase-like protein [Pseudomonadota bacterium]
MAAPTLRTPDALIAAGLAPEGERAMLERVASRYAVAVTPEMAGLMTGPDDPVSRQFLPTAAELVTLPEERADPIGDHVHSPLPGLVHRYPDRVLLKLTHTCPVYCRFCFRREMVGPAGDGMMDRAAFEAALAYVAARPEIVEVILTGGDPLILSARRIAEVTRSIAAIAHVRILRWHTRVPVVAPERITPTLVKALRAGGKAVYVAIHANHAREFTPASDAALDRLADAGIVLVSQSVLLKGINDSVEALAALMRAFLARRVKPYYLHHGDLAPGTSHFRTSITEGKALVAALRARLSGLAQPLYVIDTPGGYGKVPVERVEETGDGLAIRDLQGRLHPYPPR